MQSHLHKTFVDLENRLNLFKFKTDDNIAIWQIFRFDIYKIFTSNNSKRKLKTLSKINFLFKAIYTHFKLLWLSPNYLFIGSSRKINDKNVDLSYEFLKDVIAKKSKLNYFETNISSLQTYKGAIMSLDPILKFFSFTIFIKREERVIIDQIHSLITKGLDLKKIDKKELYVIYSFFKLQRTYYSLLIKIKRIQKIFFVKNGTSLGLIHAAKLNNIKIYEFQHGDIVFEDVTMNFHNISCENLVIPDVHFVYSSFWVANLETYSKCIEIGYNKVLFNGEVNLVQNSIVVAMDHNNELFFHELTKSLADSFGQTIYLKLHPVQFEKAEIYIRKFENYKNVKILSYEYNFDQISSKVITVVGSYSTAMYEAYDHGCHLFLYNKSHKTFSFPDKIGVNYFDSIDKLLKILKSKKRERIIRDKHFFKIRNFKALKNEIYGFD